MTEILKYNWESDGLRVKVDFEDPDVSILRTIVSRMYPSRELKIPREGLKIALLFWHNVDPQHYLEHWPSAIQDRNAELVFNAAGQVISCKIGNFSGSFTNSELGDRELVLFNEGYRLILTCSLGATIQFQNRNMFHLQLVYEAATSTATGTGTVIATQP